jgi:hypothetical protein
VQYKVFLFTVGGAEAKLLAQTQQRVVVADFQVDTIRVVEVLYLQQ